MERILVLGMTSDYGGIENYILNLYEKLDHSKLQFDFLVKEDIGEMFRKRISKCGGNIYTVGTFRNNMPKVWHRLNFFFKENRYTKIYINMSYAPTLIYILPAIGNGLEILFMHSHASDDVRLFRHKFFRFVFMNILLKNVKCIYMGCSEAACKWMYGRKICEKSTPYIVKNAVDYNKFSYDEGKRQCIRARYNLLNKVVIGHVGRFSPEKNHSFIIDAFYEFSKIISDSVLVLVGDGAEREKIEKKVRDYNLSDKVIFIGNVNDPSYYYNTMDCFWLPSVYEGFPIVAVEAQVNGLLCVFSDHIDRNVNILGNCYFQDIITPFKWAFTTSEIVKQNKRSRKIEKDVWCDTGYDLKQQTENIEELLCGEHV